MEQGPAPCALVGPFQMTPVAKAEVIREIARPHSPGWVRQVDDALVGKHSDIMGLRLIWSTHEPNLDG